MFYLYFVVALVLLWEFYGIYQAQGSLGASMGAMALGKAMLEKVRRGRTRGARRG
jgi:hypothetical protein